MLGGGHVERPTDGFAVTFPDDWTVEEVTPETDAWLFDYLDPEDRALRTTVLYADQPGSDGYCTVVDFARLAKEPPSWANVGDATLSFAAGLTEDSGFFDTERAYEALRADWTGHITATHIDEWAYDAYYFTDPEAWFYLECWSRVTPADGWLSIAETFEFLPAEE